MTRIITLAAVAALAAACDDGGSLYEPTTGEVCQPVATERPDGTGFAWFATFEHIRPVDLARYKFTAADRITGTSFARCHDLPRWRCKAAGVDDGGFTEAPAAVSDGVVRVFCGSSWIDGDDPTKNWGVRWDRVVVSARVDAVVN
jgi:hypothetical protein